LERFDGKSFPEGVARTGLEGDPQGRSRAEACPSSKDDIDRTAAIHARGPDHRITAPIAIDVGKGDGRTEPVAELLLLTQRRSQDHPTTPLFFRLHIPQSNLVVEVDSS
jgi:hypothetical protein